MGIKWESYEDDYLKEFFPHYTNDGVRRGLYELNASNFFYPDRSCNSITHRAKRLGLKKSEDHLIELKDNQRKIIHEISTKPNGFYKKDIIWKGFKKGIDI